MSLAIVNITGDTQLDSSHDGKILRVTASAVLSLPAGNSVSPGWHIPVIANRNRGSQLVGFKCTSTGDTLNYFWDKDSPYPLWMNMTQQACELVMDAPGEFFLMGKSYHRNVDQSQRTFTGTFHSIRPQELNENIQISASAPMMIVVDPVANFSPKKDIGQTQPGNYHSHRITLQRVDGTSNTVRVFASLGDTINFSTNDGSGNSGYVDLPPLTTWTMRVTAAQIWLGP